ncbi:MAG: hypothetical protein WD939_01140 [Dehalococcoidia bacterium]
MARETAAEPQTQQRAGRDYTRFIILSGPRTGSHLLAEGLNSSPAITCFGEVFNFKLAYIMYAVEGYDPSDPDALALQQRDPVGFLNERIYGEYPQAIRAVGFQYHYGHVYGFPGLFDELAGDTELRILHLKRQNVLRMLVSLKLAKTTGVFHKREQRRFTAASVARALRNPMRAAGRLGAMLRAPEPSEAPPRVQVAVTLDELNDYVDATAASAASLEERFQDHPMLTVLYEDLARDRDVVFAKAQSFLGIEPAPLHVNLQKQNPQPLRELVANYDELAASLRDSPGAWMLDS